MGLECPVCGRSDANKMILHAPAREYAFYSCKTCGRFEIDFYNELIKFDENHLASFLFYNRFLQSEHYMEYRYHSIRDRELCNQCEEQYRNGDIKDGYPIHMDKNVIDVWYPMSFSEKVDYIIQYLGTHIEHVGQQISFSYSEMISLLFVDRYEVSKIGENYENIKREKDVCTNESKYMLDSLKEGGLVEYNFGSTNDNAVFIRLAPEGYDRVDKIQKNTSFGKAVLVAMKFGDDTKVLRENIRSGIQNAGYYAVFIDEVQHNDFITPELLKHIRDSKFVVVDLTHQNNGAYFEEGYAMGLGKPVIQLCKKDTSLHFDIAQKNTIIWSSEEEIPDRLTARIKATID